MGRAVEFYFQNGLADSTRRTYASAQKKYGEVCRELGCPTKPASEPTLCRFVSHLAEGGTAHSSIKCYLAAVRQLHITEGWNDPEMGQMARLVQVLRGIKAVQAKKGGNQGRNRLPELLHKMKEVWSHMDEPRKGKMLWAASSLCFFGFFR